jgi:hypothetical protein
MNTKEIKSITVKYYDGRTEIYKNKGIETLKRRLLHDNNSERKTISHGNSTYQCSNLDYKICKDSDTSKIAQELQNACSLNFD